MTAPALSSSLKYLFDTLDGRTGGLPPDQYAYKLEGGPFQGSHALDTPVVGDLDVDESSMSMWIPIADGNHRDGVGDLLDVEGINTNRHIRNPLVLANHAKEIPWPIARARENPKDVDSYTFKIDVLNKTAGCRAFFYQGERDCALDGTCQPGTHSKFVAEMFDMAAKGFIGAGSIGYQILDGEALPPDYRNGLPQGLHLRKTLLLECSLVVLPANSSTVAKNNKYLAVLDYVTKALTGGRINGAQPSDYFKKAFTPYLPPRQALVVGGWQEKSLKVPNYRQSDEPEKSCATCSAYGPQGGSFGHCRMFDVEVGPEAVCDRWVPKQGSKAMNHGPACKCAACMKTYGKKDCACSDCQQGKSCPCGSTKAQPSEDIKPDKACQVLKDGTVHGHPLTEAQRGMFGAACGRQHGEKTIRHEGGKYVLYTHDGSRVLGRHDSREGAEAQERAVQAHKHGKSQEYAWDSKSLKSLRQKYARSKGKARRLKKSIPGHAVVHVGTKDIDNLRKDAGDRGVDIKWLADDGKGLVKLKLTGDDKSIDGLAARYGKAVRRMKALPVAVKATNPIGTLPAGSRSRASISPETLLNTPGGAEEEGTPSHLPVMSARGTKAAPPMDSRPGQRKKPEDGGFPSREPGVGSEAYEEGRMTDYPNKGADGALDMADEPFGLQATRRAHADHAGLLHEYDGISHHIEDESTQQLFQEIMEGLAAVLDKIEAHKESHERYKDFPPLEGVEEEDDLEKKEKKKDDESADTDPTSFASGPEGEPTPNEALEGMRSMEDSGIEGEDEFRSANPGEEEEDLTPEEKALYHKQVKDLRGKYGKKGLSTKQYDDEKIREQREKREKEKALYRKMLKTLTPQDGAKRKYLLKKLKAVETLLQGDEDRKHAPGHELSGKKNLNGAAMPKHMDKERDEDKKFLHKRWMELKDLDDDESKEEKSLLATWWKEMKEREDKEKKSLPTKKKVMDDKKKEEKTLSPRHRKSIIDAVKFLKDLDNEDEDFDDEKRLKAYHHGCKMDDMVGDVMGEGDNMEGMKRLAKALITEEEVRVTKPSGPNRVLKPGHDKMPYNEGSHLIKDGTYPALGDGSDVKVTNRPSSNSQLKPGHDKMPYDEGSSHLIKDGNFPPLGDNGDAGAAVNNPSSNPQLKVGKEPMQKWGEGGSLVKYLNTVVEAGRFLKDLSREKAFGVSHRTTAAQLAKALHMDEEEDKGMEEKEDKSQIPGDMEFWQEEENESEHRHKDMDEEEEKEMPYEAGAMDQKALDVLTTSSLSQSREIMALTNTLNDLVQRL